MIPFIPAKSESHDINQMNEYLARSYSIADQIELEKLSTLNFAARKEYMMTCCLLIQLVYVKNVIQIASSGKSKRLRNRGFNFSGMKVHEFPFNENKMNRLKQQYSAAGFEIVDASRRSPPRFVTDRKQLFDYHNRDLLDDGSDTSKSGWKHTPNRFMSHKVWRIISFVNHKFKLLHENVEPDPDGFIPWSEDQFYHYYHVAWLELCHQPRDPSAPIVMASNPSGYYDHFGKFCIVRIPPHPTPEERTRTAQSVEIRTREWLEENNVRDTFFKSCFPIYLDGFAPRAPGRQPERVTIDSSLQTLLLGKLLYEHLETTENEDGTVTITHDIRRERQLYRYSINGYFSFDQVFFKEKSFTDHCNNLIRTFNKSMVHQKFVIDYDLHPTPEVASIIDGFETVMGHSPRAAYWKRGFTCLVASYIREARKIYDEHRRASNLDSSYEKKKKLDKAMHPIWEGRIDLV